MIILKDETKVDVTGPDDAGIGDDPANIRHEN
jgi:hypothetical protein